MKMIMRSRNRRWFCLSGNHFDQFFTIAFLILRFKIIRNPAFPITNLPGVLKNQEIGKQQNGYYFSQLKISGMHETKDLAYRKRVAHFRNCFALKKISRLAYA